MYDTGQVLRLLHRDLCSTLLTNHNRNVMIRDSKRLGKRGVHIDTQQREESIG